MPEWIVTRKIVDEWTIEAETGPAAVKEAERIYGEAAGDTAPSHYSVETVEGERPCEGCGKPATESDIEGVPLCKECFALALADARETGADPLGGSWE